MFLDAQHLQTMIQPCSEAEPSGSWIKSERSRFRPLRNEYNIARTCFRQMHQETDPELRQPLEEKCRESWNGLSEQLISLLQSDTHDLELFGWLCEAQFFAPAPCWDSVAVAFELLTRWIKQFWWSLHPGAPEEDVENAEPGTDEIWQHFPVEKLRERLAPLQILAGESAEFGLLVMPMRLAPLLPGLSFSDFLVAEQQGQLPALHEKWRPQLLSQKETLSRTVHALWRLDNTLESLDHQLDIRAKGIWRANSFNLLRRSIARILSYLETLAHPAGCWPEKPEAAEEQENEVTEALAVTEPEEAPDSLDHAANGEVSQIEGAAFDCGFDSGTVNSREQAYIHLKQLADYFRKAEPHSPVTLLLDRALYWGRLPLPLLMQELLGDNQSALIRVCDLTGMKLDENLELMPEPKMPEIKTSAHSSVPSTQKPSINKTASVVPASIPDIETNSVYSQRPEQSEAPVKTDKPSSKQPAADVDDGMSQQLI